MSFGLESDESQTLKRVDHNPIRPYTLCIPFESDNGINEDGPHVSHFRFCVLFGAVETEVVW